MVLYTLLHLLLSIAPELTRFGAHEFYLVSPECVLTSPGCTLPALGAVLHSVAPAAQRCC